MNHIYNVILESATDFAIRCRLDGIVLDHKNADTAIAAARLMMAQPNMWKVFNVEYMGVK